MVMLIFYSLITHCVVLTCEYEKVTHQGRAQSQREMFDAGIGLEDIKYFLHYLHDLCGTDFIHFRIKNISRSPLWSSWSISSLIPCTFDKEYKQKSSVELLVYFRTDFIHFPQLELK